MTDYPVLEPGPAHDASGTRIRYGGCTCGAVRYEVRGEPTSVGTCHCTKCRKAGGAAFQFYGTWPSAAFSTTGEVRTFDGRSFCPNCGSRLFEPPEASVEIMLGSLDDAPSDLVPTREGWIIRREHWQKPVAGAEQADRDPTPVETHA